MKLRSLKDLGPVQQQIVDAKLRAIALEKARAEAAAKALAEKELFVRAVGRVKTLPDKRTLHLPPDPPAPIALQLQMDEQAVLREAISDNLDYSTLLDTDDALSFRRPGVGADVTRKLRKGDWSIQREIDLHGLRREDAREALGAFIREAHRHGIRCVRVVTGKGLGSPGKMPVLKSKALGWLIQKNEVLAFVQAKPAEGGAGALIVLLQPAS
ncbi:MAG: Smr/MutS family protein [Pseudomonadota bacterium]